MSEETSCITINCGCCGSNMSGTESKGDGNPVGTVIAYMGTKAPLHYLACNGAMLNIADYQALSDQILDEFGAVNYFGGDGTTTFAVPDLRNEFLRGYHEEAEEQLSDNIGVHQEATSVPNFYISDYGKSLFIGINDTDLNTPGALDSINFDKKSNGKYGYAYQSALQSKFSSTPPGRTVTVRPANVAVLYCIKYE